MDMQAMPKSMRLIPKPLEKMVHFVLNFAVYSRYFQIVFRTISAFASATMCFLGRQIIKQVKD